MPSYWCYCMTSSFHYKNLLVQSSFLFWKDIFISWQCTVQCFSEICVNFGLPLKIDLIFKVHIIKAINQYCVLNLALPTVNNLILKLNGVISVFLSLVSLSLDYFKLFKIIFNFFIWTMGYCIKTKKQYNYQNLLVCTLLLFFAGFFLKHRIG